jgi:hypothetical protein
MEMQFEALICTIFERNGQNFSQGTDPLGFGNADYYINRYSNGEENYIRGKMMLASALGALAYRNPVISNKIQEIILKLASAKTPNEIDNEIVKSVDLVNSMIDDF